MHFEDTIEKIGKVCSLQKVKHPPPRELIYNPSVESLFPQILQVSIRELAASGLGAGLREPFTGGATH